MVLDRHRTEYEVAKVTLFHRPGELARAASRLGEAGIRLMVLRRYKVEIGNSGSNYYYWELQNLRDPLHFPTSAVLKEPD